MKYGNEMYLKYYLVIYYIKIQIFQNLRLLTSTFLSNKLKDIIYYIIHHIFNHFPL